MHGVLLASGLDWALSAAHSRKAAEQQPEAERDHRASGLCEPRRPPPLNLLLSRSLPPPPGCTTLGGLVIFLPFLYCFTNPLWVTTLVPGLTRPGRRRTECVPPGGPFSLISVIDSLADNTRIILLYPYPSPWLEQASNSAPFVTSGK